MIIEITSYKAANGITHKQLVEASRMFDKNYCSRCKGLVSRHFLKTSEGYMDIFKWKSKQDVEYVQSTFLQDKDALEFAKMLDPDSLTVQNLEVLDLYESKN